MDYTLTSTREVEGLKQKIISILKDGYISSSTLELMKGWHNMLAKYDGSHPVGTIEYGSFTTKDTGIQSKAGVNAKITVTVKMLTSAYPKYVTFEGKGAIDGSDYTDTLSTAFSALGMPTLGSNNVIVSAILELE